MSGNSGSGECIITNERRLRLRPWILSKLESNNIVGLEWRDERAKIFKIPWYHSGKNGWSSDKGQVFKEWAIHTGKFSEGVDKPNPTKWKTNLRCALHKAKDIQELTEPADLEHLEPFRSYKFLKIKKNKQIPIEVPDKPRSLEEGAPNIPVFVKDYVSSGSSGSYQSDKSKQPVAIQPKPIVNTFQFSPMSDTDSNSQTSQSEFSNREHTVHTNGVLPSTYLFSAQPGDSNCAVAVTSRNMNVHNTYVNSPPQILAGNIASVVVTSSGIHRNMYVNSPPQFTDQAYNSPISVTSSPSASELSDLPLSNPPSNQSVESAHHMSIDEISGLVSLSEDLKGLSPQDLLRQSSQYPSINMEMFSGSGFEQFNLPQTEQSGNAIVPPNSYLPDFIGVEGTNLLKEMQSNIPIEQYINNNVPVSTVLSSATNATSNSALPTQHNNNPQIPMFGLELLSEYDTYFNNSGARTIITQPGDNRQLASALPVQSTDNNTGILAYARNDLGTGQVEDNPNNPAIQTSPQDALGDTSMQNNAAYNAIEGGQVKHKKQKPKQATRYDKFSTNTLLSLPFKSYSGNDMYIELVYKNNIIEHWHVNNPDGCLLFFNEGKTVPDCIREGAHYGEGYELRTHLKMPAWPNDLPNNVDNEKATRKACEILDNSERGVVLECNNGNITIIRNCKTSVYSSCKTNPKISRTEDRSRTTIFDLNQFLDLFNISKHRMTLEKPKPHVDIYFGQKGDGLSPEEVLVMLRVTSCQALRELQRYAEENKMSTSIHVSCPDQQDQLVELVKNISILEKGGDLNNY